MKKKGNKTDVSISIIATIFFAVTLVACTGTYKKDTKQQKPEKGSSAKAFSKPPASFSDTLYINTASAVFYRPDSLQLEKIKAETNIQRFDGIMHEYESQMNNARDVLKQYWPKIKIIETDSARYILFGKEDGQLTYIDLNTKNDICGMILFNGKKDPEQADMMNIDTDLDFYFKK